MIALLVSYGKNIVLSLADASLVLSLINWKVDIDSKEGNDLDQYFKELVNNILKK